jgi:predicted RNA binding protein YcfA (HicA-like mRNA interferase family)
MPVSGKKLVSILEKHGWVVKRINGSHHIMVKDGEIANISVPVHGNKDLKKGLLNAILKTAKIDKI